MTSPSLIGDNQRAWNAQVVPVAAAAFEAWKREARPPFDTEQFMTIIVCLLDGFALRRLTDPDPVTDEVITETILLLVLALTRPIGDDSTMEDLTAPIDDFPIVEDSDAGGDRPADHDEQSA